MGIFNSWLGKSEKVVVDLDDPGYSLSMQRADAHDRGLSGLEELVDLRNAATLKALTAKVMVADATHTIVSINPATLEMMRNAQAEIRKDLPNFTADKLLGSKMDVFHRNPNHIRGVLDALTKPHKSRLAIGGRSFDLVASPIFDDQRKRMGTVVEWDDISDRLNLEAEKEQLRTEALQASGNARLKSALDQLETALMIVDRTNVIEYGNDCLMQMFRNCESEIRKEVPGFSTARLVGSSLDGFFSGNLGRGQGRTELKLGERVFVLNMSALTDESGSRCGTVLEWKDRTEELHLEQSILVTVENAIAGDLHGRIASGVSSDTIANMAAKINLLLETFGKVIDETAVVMSALAEGKLTHRISSDFRGVFGKLKGDVNLTVDKLINVVNEIRDCAGSVKSGSSEIASGNSNLSQRTEQQAASLEETSAAMEQITSTVQQNAANAVQANTLARGARESAENGGDVVNNAVAAMQAISESSNRINDIIGVIDEIAFQTNLLALNAAVEAARAGDQGRGFAVVADEVRNLAGRSATAAKEIKELIKDSGEKVKEGSRLVNKSGETLEEIVTAVKKVNDIVAEISTASDEQATGLDEINRSVGEMDDMTQQNAALVEQAAAASEALGEQAMIMERLIGFFDLGSAARAWAPAPVLKAPVAAMTRTTRAPAKKFTPVAARKGVAPRKPLVKTAIKPAAGRLNPGKKAVDDDDKNWAEF